MGLGINRFSYAGVAQETTRTISEVSRFKSASAKCLIHWICYNTLTRAMCVCKSWLFLPPAKLLTRRIFNLLLPLHDRTTSVIFSRMRL